MASKQLRRGEGVAKNDEGETMEGRGPEYEYPTTKKDEPIPVLDVATEDVADEEGGKGISPVVGEDLLPLDDRTISREEKLEEQEAGKWNENMAENLPRPGEVEDTLPEERERLPSDRG